MVTYGNIKNDRYIYLPAILALRAKKIKYLVEKERTIDCIIFYACVDQPKGHDYWTLSYDSKNKVRQHALIKATKLIKYLNEIKFGKRIIVEYDREEMILTISRDISKERQTDKKSNTPTYPRTL